MISRAALTVVLMLSTILGNVILVHGKSTSNDYNKIDLDKEINTLTNSKNLIKTFVKLFFGTNEESAATTRQVLNVMVKVSFFHATSL